MHVYNIFQVQLTTHDQRNSLIKKKTRYITVIYHETTHKFFTMKIIIVKSSYYIELQVMS
jgi:hypothetical protein